MDWTRAKSVLLLAFLCLNIVLLQQLNAQRPASGGLVTALQAAAVEKTLTRLAEAGIRVEARVPRSLVSLPRLLVRPGTSEGTALPQEFLGPDYVQVWKRVGFDVYRSPGDVDSLLVLWHDGRGYYGPTRRQGFGLTGALGGWWDSYFLQVQARQYLEGFALSDLGWRFDYAVALGDDHEAAVFFQVFEGYPVFGSPLVVWFHHRQPLGLSWNSLSLEGFSAPERAVWPATEALLAAADTPHLPPGSVVSRVELGYHVEMADALAWEMSPSWRLLLTSGQQVMVDAYTGEVRRGPSWVAVDGAHSILGP